MSEFSRPPDPLVPTPSERGPSKNMIAVIVAVAVILFCGLAALILVVVTGGDEVAAPSATDAAVATIAAPTGAGEVLLEPVAVPMENAFSTSVSTQTEKSPTVTLPDLPIPTTSAPWNKDQVPLAQVAGNEPGLYGGTRDVAACDAEQLTTFLEANPDKAAAWAGVQGIEPSEIREFVAGLTPVTLTRDTRVTNHGFVDGRAAPHQSVLEAGHAVFVDEFGVPRAKCSCGNPLAPPEPLTTAPTYVGDPWPGFDPTTIIVIIATVPVDGGFVVVDTDTGELITVPIGRSTTAEPPANPPVEPPAEPPANPPAEPPVDQPVDADLAVVLVDVGNIMGVTPGAASAASFTIDAPTLITSVQNYHYGPETAPGQVGLTSGDGSFYGPWQTVGTEGQGGVANAYWTAEPWAVVPAGTYTVWDSEPSTWSTNADAGGVGFTVVQGVVGVLEPPDAPGVMPDTGGEPAWSPADAAGEILDQLLLDCGAVYQLPFIDGGGNDNGWRWLVATPEGSADFYVGFVDGPDGWYVQDNNIVATELAQDCGFLEVG
jgi:hypothetical protein